MSLSAWALISVDESSLQSAIGVNPAVTEKWPVRALRIEGVEVRFDDEDFFLAGRSFRHNLPRRIGDETLPPKFDAVAAVRRFVPDAVRHRDVAAIGDGV